MARYQTIPKFSTESGYTEDAIRGKIKTGVWLENVLWVRAPDDRILIDTEKFQQWVEKTLPSDPLRKPRSNSTSTITRRAAAND